MGEIKQVNFSIEHLLSEKHLKHQEGRSGKKLDMDLNMDLNMDLKYGLKIHKKV